MHDVVEIVHRQTAIGICLPGNTVKSIVAFTAGFVSASSRKEVCYILC